MNGHTDRDAAALGDEAAAKTQPREHDVRCFCGTKTAHQAGFCDAHYQPPTRHDSEPGAWLIEIGVPA